MLVAQSCPTLCDPMNNSPPGSSVHGSPGKSLEWIAIPFSRGSSQHRDQTWASCIASGLFTTWAIREAFTLILLVRTPGFWEAKQLAQGHSVSEGQSQGSNSGLLVSESQSALQSERGILAISALMMSISADLQHLRFSLFLAFWWQTGVSLILKVDHPLAISSAQLAWIRPLPIAEPFGEMNHVIFTSCLMCLLGPVIHLRV